MKKTTKIIGAVLGVLLVAALFTGAVAAGTSGTEGGASNGAINTAYGYVLYPNDTVVGAADTVWALTDDHGMITGTQIVTVSPAAGKFYLSGLVTEGRYVQTTDTSKVLIVKFPEVAVSASINNASGAVGALYDGFIPKGYGYMIGAKILLPTTSSGLRGNVEWQIVDDASGAVTKVEVNGDGFIQEVGAEDPLDFKNYANGLYYLQPYFATSALAPGAGDLAYGEMIPFTVGKAGDEKITLSAEEINEGKSFVATVYGLPGVVYNVTVPYTYVSIPAQKDVTIKSTAGSQNDIAEFTMGASGVFDISLKAEKQTDEATISLASTAAGSTLNESAGIKITEGILTAEAEFDAYTIGDDIKLSGKSAGKDLYFYIEGVNVLFKQIKDSTNQAITTAGEEWEQTLKYADIISANTVNHGLDAGTYTIYVSTVDDPDKADVTAGTYVTVPVALKQSFITITDAPTAVAQGEKIVVEGTANAAKSVIWYLFGTNFFEAGVQKVKDDEFKITIEKEYTDKDHMAAGQYFLVIQHPMYDEKFSIAPNYMFEKNVTPETAHSFWTSGDSSLSKAKAGALDGKWGSIIKSDKNGIYKSGATLDGAEGLTKDYVEIFGAEIRQTANAAQALCDALDSQNFDDMYAKASFIVGAPTSVINPIPAKIAQGEILKISGTTTGYKGAIVNVEFLAAAFAAVPKEAVGTAGFLTVMTKVQDDGTWAIEFDTSELNVDDYNVSVTVGDAGAATSKLTVVKAGEPVPTQTTVPTGQPTTAPTTAPTQTPASPGFGILAALAGLGAVAVLLLRRQ